MKKFIILLKPLLFLPAIFMMCLIFSFSAQTGTKSGNLSHKISYTIADSGNRILRKEMPKKEVERLADKLEFPIRKLAHMTEYFLLTASVLFPLYVYGLRGRALFLTAGIFCVCFAATDEYHQSFVAGRRPSIKDVGIDSIGMLAALTIAWIAARKR